ncbi:hypothetical protein CDD80_3290 [Ophiocordyceps camponoti-rufipedis]|uniref:Uncharacterized protein n=1 Tax=Ophiocordyceps camponoti-rufipedis TaxID=2004952 RepID=A0A2C5Z4L9_9HYPO|nr:hypothetical protein CDD80_3290 [Ophiocordyceps camponoti-rufipedis]
MKYDAATLLLAAGTSLARPTVTRRDGLLPWKQMTAACDADHATEEYCGTDAICDMYRFGYMPNPAWNSWDECINAHESRYSVQPPPARSPPGWETKKPWTELTDEAKCSSSMDRVEKFCGTERYCASFSRPFGRSKYQSERECLDHHEKAPKKPWLEPTNHVACASNLGRHEQQCGTKVYCQSFDRLVGTGHRYASEQECLDAHEPEPAGSNSPDDDNSSDDNNSSGDNKPASQPKKPWLQPGAAGPCAASMGTDEKHCGTKVYCEQFNYAGGDRQYGSEQECLDAHEPESAGSNSPADSDSQADNKPAGSNPPADNKPTGQPKKPWVQPGAAGPCAASMGTDEKHCGTKVYCEQFNYAGGDRQYGSEQECLDAHEPESASNNPSADNKPASSNPPANNEPSSLSKKPWLEPGAAGPCAASMGTDEKHCGTKVYCEQFNYAGGDRQYGSEQECLDDHEPESTANGAPADNAAPTGGNPQADNKPPSQGKKPWLQPQNPSACAHVLGRSEQYCGTGLFCKYVDTNPHTEYKTERECLDDHEPEPTNNDPPEDRPPTIQYEPAKPKKPWVELEDLHRCYGQKPRNEHWCGTRIYCASFRYPAGEQLEYSSEQECLDDHLIPWNN